MKNEPTPYPPPSLPQKSWYLDFFLVPILLGILLFAGHYGLLFGETFFVDFDAVSFYKFSEESGRSGGWRPDSLFGQSYFASDPGAQHVWSLSRFWQGMFEDGRFGYQAQLFISIWAACFVLYSFLKKLVPNISRGVAFLLSSSIAFGSLRYEFFFLRAHIVDVPCACLLSLVLWDFLKHPKIRHYFYYTTILCILTYLGSINALLKALTFIGIFCIGVAVYNRWYFTSKELRVALKQFFLLNIVSGLSLLILGAWVFYSMFVEMSTVEYVRDPDYSKSSFFSWPGVKVAAATFFQYFHAGSFSLPASILGLVQNIGTHSWNNFSPVFPVIFFIFVFHKSRTFWEFISKFVILTSFLFQEIYLWVPGIFAPAAKLMIFYPPAGLAPYIQVFEILLTGFLLARLKDHAANWRGWSVKLARIVAGLLAPIYLVLGIIVFITTMMPELILRTIEAVSPTLGSESTRDFLAMLAVENVHLFHETMGWSSILFYGTTALFLMILARKQWHWLLTRKGGLIFAIALLINNILLAWAVYPLSKEPMLWDTFEMNGKPLVKIFSPTDRLASVGLPRCRGNSDYYECIKRKFFNEEFGPMRYIVGHKLAPVLYFNTIKSVTPKPIADWIFSFMHLEETYKPGILRSFTMPGYLPIFSSRIYDLGAINYIVSGSPIPPTTHLELVFKGKQFYLYKNLRAWPYFYLADHIVTIKSYEDLYNAEQGVAYLWADGKRATISEKKPKKPRSIKLLTFEYGDLKFQYQSAEPEFLVIADSWHPNWRANVNGTEVPIFKANGVFKGILLPPGQGTVNLFFDNSRYQLGIWVSIITCSLFLLGWIWAAKRFPEKY
jgi:hypothetical protein